MERWYWASVISLDDKPASAVAKTVRMTGVIVRIPVQKLLG
jgi:hypothetical protein